MGEQRDGPADYDRTSQAGAHDMLAVAHMRQGKTHEAGRGQPGPALPVSLQLRGHRLDLGVGLEGLVAHLAAGRSFHAAISSGKFHGMIWPTTPTGSRSVYEWKLAPGMAGRPAGRHSGVMIAPPGLPPGCPPWFARPAARAWT